jgi:hypothetical protein
LEAAEHWLKADISDTKQRLAPEIRAQQSGDTLWYIRNMEGYDEAGEYTVIEGGTTPGTDVKNAVAKIFYHECVTGVGWFSNEHDC